MERVKRFELSTSTLARSRSTTELHPQKMRGREITCISQSRKEKIILFVKILTV